MTEFFRFVYCPFIHVSGRLWATEPLPRFRWNIILSFMFCCFFCAPAKQNFALLFYHALYYSARWNATFGITSTQKRSKSVSFFLLPSCRPGCVLHISYNVGQTMAIGLPLLSPLADRIDRFERGGKASSTTHLSLVKETLKGGGARREGMIKWQHIMPGTTFNWRS